MPRRNWTTQRGDFLLNWFLQVYDGRKAPYPAHAFKGIAHQMRLHLARVGSGYSAKYQLKPKGPCKRKKRV